jgi:LysM repeat protein
MIAGAMAMVGWRNPARYLAPLAIAAAGTATYVIVHNALKHKHAAPPALVAPRTSTTQSQGAHTPSHPKARLYVVRQNDTLSKIAARTGVSLGTIEHLNPSVTPNALHAGQRLRLR